MTNHLNLKEIVSSVAHVAHELKENITHATKTVHSLATNLENSLKEKGVKEISCETCSGHDTRNVIANALGEIATNNDNELTRGLFNHVLFTEGGELRLSNVANDSSKNNLLRMVTNPATEIHPSQSSKFIPTPEKQQND
jgi:N-acyl-D-aspartate/D-glutamate deacylase